MKFTKFLLITAAALCLSSCDALGGLFGGDDEEEGEFDPNLYTLQLKVNLQDEEFQDIGIEYVQKSEEEMDFLVSQYGSKGLTKENLQKVGTFENGKYYFMSQDGFHLKAPQVIGYELLGWFDGDTQIDGGYDYNFDGITDNLVNMPAKNTVLEAKYAPVEYKFRVNSKTENKLDENSTVVAWKITDGDLDLSQYLSNDESKIFKQWDLHGNYFDVSEGIINVGQYETPDPRSYKSIENISKIDKSVLSQLGDVAYGYVKNEMDLTAVYETKQCSVKISWIYGADARFYIMVANAGEAYTDPYPVHWFEKNFNDGTNGEKYSNTLTLKWGTLIKISYELIDPNYTFDGYYDGNTYLSSSSEYILSVNGDKDININITYNAPLE